MVRCLAGLQKPAQSNPRNAPCLKRNSHVGEHGWGLEGWCEIPGSGHRAAGELLGNRVQHLCAAGSQQPWRGMNPVSLLSRLPTPCARSFTVSLQRGRQGTEQDLGFPLISSFLRTTFILKHICLLPQNPHELSKSRNHTSIQVGKDL